MSDRFSGTVTLTPEQRAYLASGLAELYVSGVGRVPPGHDRLLFTQELAKAVLNPLVLEADGPAGDDSVVTPGWPTEGGTWLLWWDWAGWPAVSVVVVDVDPATGRAVYFIGGSGTDRRYEAMAMFRIPDDGFRGHSRPTPEAFARFERMLGETRVRVRGMLRNHPGG